jgi:hypothetical protein
VTCYLLDVNVLIALIDTEHVHHDLAHDWFETVGKTAWATCPLTENGVLRILGSPKYPNSPGSPAKVAQMVVGLRSLEGHVFWPDSISLVGNRQVRPERLLSAGQITDTYLLALALANRGKLASLDRRLVTDAVHHGQDHLHLIGH